MGGLPRVLVADDDRELLEAVTTAVERIGAEVVSVQTGGELIEHLADDGAFALVLTDLAMPWMNGLQAMRAARNAGLDTPFVVMTALDLAQVGKMIAAAAAGAVVAVLRKPFELAELEEIVRRVIEKKPGG